MIKIITLIAILTAGSVHAQISTVNTGDAISSAKINSMITEINKMYDIGDVRTSMLTESQFQSRNGSCWVLMKGQSASGSLYATLTGNQTLPNATTEGTFLRQAKANRVLGSFENHATASPTNPFSGTISGTAASGGGHSHTARISNNFGGNTDSMVAHTGGSGGNNATSGGSGVINTGQGGAHSHSVTGTAVINAGGDEETRVKNIAVNMFIKINNCN